MVMFWRKARKLYGGLNSKDKDIERYLQIASELQEEGYKGMVGWIQDMGHRWVAKRTPPGPVLEIGFGIGRHRLFFSGNVEDYFVSEYSALHLSSREWKEFKGRGVRCDARSLPYHATSFRTVISIYALEHINELESVLTEIHRVLEPGGQFLIALPCEDGLLWNIGRELTTRRKFHKQKGINYDKVIAFEHIWSFTDILKKVRSSVLFHIDSMEMLPFKIRSHHINLISCFQCSVIK
jgi:ubiquinone/menaquinone biosynthesis C-methylase UbiE